MTTLSQKFESFEFQAASNHALLMERLQYTNDLLGQIIIALNNPTPVVIDQTAVIAAITALQTPTDNISEQIDVIRNAIRRPNEAAPGYVKSSMEWALYRIMDMVAVPADYGVYDNMYQLMLYNNIYIRDVLGQPTDAPQSLLQYVRNMNSNLGESTDGADGTVIALLRALRFLTERGISGVPPTTTPDTIGGQSTVEANGQNYVIWPATMPYGIQHTNTLSVPDRAEIAPPAGGSWAGWKLYVQSNAPFWDDNRTSANVQLPTNRLLNLEALFYAFAVSVNSQFSVAAFLYPPEYAGCIAYDSSQAGDGRAFINFPGGVNSELQTPGDFYGYRITMLAASAPGLRMNIVGYVGGSFTLLGELRGEDLETHFIVSQHTTTFGLYERIIDSVASFSVEVCPPAS